METQILQYHATLELHLTESYAELTGNREALHGAIQNLINNALQACGDSANLMLSAHLCEQNNVKAVIISLRDDGPGIPKNLQEQIFEPFYTTRSRGTGLGLAVVKSVAHAHNGTMWVESEDGQGTKFSLFLPLKVNSSALSSGQLGSRAVRSAALSEDK